MSSFDYVLALVSIIIGLALTDIAVSAHRLLRQARSVVWDLRTVLSAAFAALLALYMWFEIVSVGAIEGLRAFPMFLTFFAEFLLVYLICAAALPDEASEGTDLRAYYDRNRRYFWGLALAYQASYLGHWLYFVWPRLFEPGWLAGRPPQMLVFLVVPPVAHAWLMLGKGGPKLTSAVIAGLTLVLLSVGWQDVI